MTLYPNPTTPFLVPEFLRGPRDGEIGEMFDLSNLLGTIRAKGGNYSLEGFRHVSVHGLENVTPDHAVYVWSASR